MHRKIEYKAFLKNREKIVKVTKINFEESYIEYIDHKGYTTLAFFSDIKLFQFTGLYDMKDTPIYEGDIVIFYNKKYIIMFDEETASFIAYDEEFEEKVRFINENNKRMEVIGNVFLDKKLLD